MNEALALPNVLVFTGALVATAVASRRAGAEARVMLVALVAHAVASWAHVQIMVRLYGVGFGDMWHYEAVGRLLAEGMDNYFSLAAPEVLNLLMQQEAALPDVVSQSSSTGSMMALSALILYATSGSIYTLGLCASMLAFAGKWSLYVVLRSRLTGVPRLPLQIACLFLPTGLLWSSGFLKEALAVAGIGFFVKGLSQLADRIFVSGVSWLLVGTMLVGLFKPYTLFALAAGGGIWWFVARQRARGSRITAARLAFGVATAASLMLALGEVFPRFALDNVAEEAARLQAAGQWSAGGSNYEIGNPMDSSLAGQLRYAPIALVSAWYRPFLFEATSAQVFVNALETTWILWLTWSALRLQGLSGLRGVLRRHPLLLFCLTFCVVFGVAVGLATTNLGTLSRYRMPLLPFLLALLFAWRHGVRDVSVASPVLGSDDAQANGTARPRLLSSQSRK